MPLVRVEVRNEFKLGGPEIYRVANSEDPKEILDGVSVAGLVGVLRQLGDLAEFAAEVFHGLQEEVMATSSRCHKLMACAQQIEAALSPIEKAVLAQRSHLHFAYMSGLSWHAHIQCKQNHLIYSDLPQFILDSYEDCRGLPCLHLLDRFDCGGPGSCLKRYSDPTLFKNASADFNDAGIKKIPKSKNIQKIKRRRSWLSRGEIMHEVPLSEHGGRMEFIQPNVGGHSSPSQTVSTHDDVTLTADLGGQSNLNSRNGSSYIENDFRFSKSLQPEALEPKASISSPEKGQDSDFFYYNFTKQNCTTDVHENSEINLLQEQTSCSSSSVTWDERTIEPIELKNDTQCLTQADDQDKSIESLQSNSDREALGDSEVNLESVGMMDANSCNASVSLLKYGDVHLDDIDSETDQFLDALNTIELESETDLDVLKQKVKDYTNLQEGADDGLCKFKRNNPECQDSRPESSNLFKSFSIKDSCGDDPVLAADLGMSSVSSLDKDLLSVLKTGNSINPGSMQNVNSLESGNMGGDANIESVSGTAVSSCTDDQSGVLIINEARSSPDSQTPDPEASNVASVMFWTNGGLLGLQPSKPPDCSSANTLAQNSLSIKDGNNYSSQVHMSGDKNGRKTEHIKNLKNNTNADSSIREDYGESGSSFSKVSWKIPPADLELKLRNANNYSSNAPKTMARDTLSINSKFQDTSDQDNSRNRFSLFGIGDELVATESNKKLLHCGKENSTPAVYRTLSGRTKDLLDGGSPLLAPSASPPLEHMKISFQPIDGFAVSKLKLQFPDRKENHNDSGKDIFPSFQLVPEISSIWPTDVSDSDDDTFYRSSPSLIDDCLSHHSELNSEKLESRGSTCGKDDGLYNAFSGVSLSESVSTLLETGKKSTGMILENCGLNFPFVKDGQSLRSFHSFELQSLDTLNHSLMPKPMKHEKSQDSESHVTGSFPPLPPVEGRGMEPHLNGIQHEYEAMPEATKCSFNVKLSAPTVCQQPKAAPLSQDQIIETNIQNTKLLGLQKPEGLREESCKKNTDGKEDFLHQIRAKSFNLRPTATIKPTVPADSQANVQVTAILNKANAVRQAVGSDDEEDTW